MGDSQQNSFKEVWALLTVEIWNRVCRALRCRVYAIFDDMFVELPLARFNKGKSIPVREPPYLRTEDRS